MTLKDPFNRQARRRETEYAAFRESLIEAGLTTHTQADALLANIRKRAVVIAGVVACSTALIVLFFPEMKGFVLVFAVLGLFWLIGITIKGQGFVRRYIEEECTAKPEQSEQSDFRA